MCTVYKRDHLRMQYQRVFQTVPLSVSPILSIFVSLSLSHRANGPGQMIWLPISWTPAAVGRAFEVKSLWSPAASALPTSWWNHQGTLRRGQPWKHFSAAWSSSAEMNPYWGDFLRKVADPGCISHRPTALSVLDDTVLEPEMELLALTVLWSEDYCVVCQSRSNKPDDEGKLVEQKACCLSAFTATYRLDETIYLFTRLSARGSTEAVMMLAVSVSCE